MSNETNNDNKSTSFGEWTLEDLLKWMKKNNATFCIPDYQRGYAWGERQLADFWDDLCSPTKRHYTGAITVEEVLNKPGNFDVVDGQQRLTTIAILFSILDQGNLLCSHLVYGEDNENSAYFSELKSSVFDSRAGEDGKIEYSEPDSLKNPENVYQRNLIYAKKFFLKKTFENEKKISKQKLVKKTLNKLRFDFRILGGDFNSGIVFETMNNRGKPLTLLEKLKNRLIYLADNLSSSIDKNVGGELQGSPDLRGKINDAWGTIYHELASDPNREPLDEDEFVASHLSVYRNPKESVYSESVAETRLFKMFCAHPERHPKSEDIDEENKAALAKAEKDGKMEEVLTSKKIVEYVNDLMAFASAWATIHKQFDSACGQCRLLSGTREIKVFLAVVALHVKEKEVREAIYEKARQILFRNTINAGMDKARFATFARQLHGACIDQLKRGSQKRILPKELFDELDKVLNDQKKKPSKETLLGYFADRQKGDFYGWSEQGLRYFLLRHEPDFAAGSRLTWEKYDDISIEHILPQSSTKEKSRGWRWWGPVIEDWVQQCGKADAGDALVDSLGNLVLLSRDENSEISNRAWESYNGRPGKRDFYLDENKTSSNGAVALASEKDSAGNPRSWNAFRIRERGRDLFRKLASDFGVEDELSDDDIDEALGIGVRVLEDKKIRELTPEEIGRNIEEDAREAKRLTDEEKCAFLRALGRAFEQKNMRGRASEKDMQFYPNGNKKLYFEIRDDQVRLILSCQNQECREAVWTTHGDGFTTLFSGMGEIDHAYERSSNRTGPRYIRFKYADFPDANNSKLLNTMVKNFREVYKLLDTPDTNGRILRRGK